MTIEEFEKAAESLKKSVTDKRCMAAELINGKEQCIMSDTFECDWDNDMVYCYNFGCRCAAFPVTSVVRLVVH